MTPKKKVLAKFPQAVCYRDKYGRFQIADAKLLGSGTKERDAWADAAGKIV